LQHNARETDCLLALAQGEPERAVALADEAIALDRPDSFRLGLVNALALKGRGLVALGRQAEAKATYEEARAVAEAIGSRRALWPILAALARLEAAQGNHAAAYELRRQSRVVLEYIADHISSPDLRASLFNLPDAREVMGQGETA
jgi:tetratricopeptide (TPR) repeat protein